MKPSISESLPNVPGRSPEAGPSVREAARSSWPPGAHLAFTFLAGVFFATLVGLALTGRPGLLVGSRRSSHRSARRERRPLLT